MFRKYFPLSFLFVVLIVLAFIHTTGLRHFWYWEYPWFDIITHFMGGGWVGGMFLWFRLFYRNNVGRVNPSLLCRLTRPWVCPARAGGVNTRALFAETALFLLVVAFFWEVLEYVGGVAFVAKGGYVLDTAIDFLMGLIGAFVAFIVFIVGKFREPNFRD